MPKGGRYGDMIARKIRERIAQSTATTTTLKALPVDHPSRIDGCLIAVLASSGSLWIFDADSSDSADAGIAVPDSGDGRWFLVSGAAAGVDLASTESGEGASAVAVQDGAGRFASGHLEGVTTDLGARIALAFDDTTAQTAYSTTARADRQIAIVDNDDAGAQADGSLWMFDSGSSAGATDYVRVPDAGTGRWLRLIPTLAELVSAANGLGLSLLGLEDPDDLLAATDGEAAIVEIAARMCTAVVAAADATGGSTDSALTVDLKSLNGAALSVTGVVKITVTATQYAGAEALVATATFNTASLGSILASGNGWAVVKCDSSGQFACTLANSADVTNYVAIANVDGGLDALANGLAVVGCVPDSVSWGA